MNRRLALVSAPAGFGKTTIVVTWIETSGHATAWLSLDGSDANLTRFLTYLITALQTVDPILGQNALQALQFSQSPPPEDILTALINDLSTINEPLILVLDDYHVVNVTPVNDAVAFLLNHLPPSVQVVITTREDPQLPLARLRACGEMTEIRAADLRFTASEAAIFLGDVMGLNLLSEEVAMLETRTEGWVAGLQMAALSVRGREDTAGFIQAFAGTNRYIVDFLVEEVLHRQPDEVLQFLLQSSVLERMSGSLCDAVTGRDDSTSLLESLERGNLFVMPLDDKRQWYRYHQLFLEVLRAHAMEEDSDEVLVRHRRASEWFDQHDMPVDAIHHAFAAEDLLRAAQLIEFVALRMLGSSEEAILWEWLESIPDDLVPKMPVLSAYYGFASFSRSGFEAAEARFRDAERWLDGSQDTPAGEMLSVNQSAFRSLPGTIAVGRAYTAGALGDVEGIIAYARQALDVMPDDDELWSGAASSVLGIGLWTQGKLQPAYQALDEGKRLLDKAGYKQFQIVSVHNLADIRIAQGRLREAERIYRESLELATNGEAAWWGTVDLLVGLSELSWERNDLDLARHFLYRSKELGDHAGLVDTRHRWYIAMAAIMQAEADFDGALTMLDEAARSYVPGADPELRPIAVLKVRVWIAQGQLAEAINWAYERNRAAGDTISYFHEFEYLTVVQVLIASARQSGDTSTIDQAIVLLDQLLEAAERGERNGSMISILIQQALAYEAKHDIPAALKSLGRALALAEPEGYVRSCIEAGPPMLRLLTEAQAKGVCITYTERLIRAMVPADRARNVTAAQILSEREIEVLRLVANGLSNGEIAEQLYLALDTVKGHNRRIFAKLGARRRTEAIVRAHELGLLDQ